jgi:hypothetical protein
MNKPSVDPTFTFGVALVVSAVLWFPTLRETMAGNLDITDAGIRYFLALALSWAGVYGVSAIVAMYASQPRRQAPPPPDHPSRRRDDPPADPVTAASASAPNEDQNAAA